MSKLHPEIPPGHIWPSGEDGKPVNRHPKKEDIGTSSHGKLFVFFSGGWKPLTESDEEYNELYPIAETENLRISSIVNEIPIQSTKDCL